MKYVMLESTGILRAEGPEAIAFLQGQLTSDVAGLATGGGQVSGYCTPKGRLLASFVLSRTHSGCLLLLPLTLAEPIRKRLAMYILRSRVTVMDVTAGYRSIGFVGDGAAEAAQQMAGAIPASTYGVAEGERATVIRLPGERYLCLAPSAGAAHGEAIPASAERSDADCWHELDIRNGIPVITPATQEAFVPQMVNFDLIGAVSYTKGCYPGQEIVARTHYLGRVKQRMFRAHIDTPHRPAPGERLYGTASDDQSCGLVVNSASTDGGHDVLAVVQTASFNAGEVHWKDPAGPLLAFRPLPYAVPH